MIDMKEKLLSKAKNEPAIAKRLKQAIGKKKQQKKCRQQNRWKTRRKKTKLIWCEIAEDF